MTRRERHLQRVFDVATAIAAIATPFVLIALVLDPPERLEHLLRAVNWGLWGVFALETVVMLAVSPDRAGWLRRYPVTPVIVILTLPAFGGLDLFRLVHLLRGPVARRAADAVTSEEGLRNLALLTLLTIGLGGVLFAKVEPDIGVADGLYWAVTTATTVGYGDPLPTTTTGKVLAVYVMLLGVGFLAVLTGAAAERFIGRWRDQRDAALARAVPAATPSASAQDSVLAKLDELGERLAALERAVSRERG